MCDTDKGYLTFEEMRDLMVAFKFDLEDASVADFLNEFNFTLLQKPGELRKEHLEAGDAVFRFDLARSIFLERGL